MNLRLSSEQRAAVMRIAPPAALLAVLVFAFFLHREYFSASPQTLLGAVAASDVASLTNEARIENGLPPLAVNPLLTEAAQLKADNMAAFSYYAHTGPDGKTMLDWMNEVGYHYLNAGENLVIDRTTAQQAVDAWMNSPDHRANILRPQFTQIGVGVAEGEYQGLHTIFVVQEFGTPYPSAETIASAARTAAAPAPVVKAASATKISSAPAASTPAAKVPAPLSIPKVPAPSAIPHVASLAPRTVIASSTVTSSAASTASSTPAEQGSSTIVYTLAPEFYTPVTLSSTQTAKDSVLAPAPKAASASRISVFIDKIMAYISTIFNG